MDWYCRCKLNDAYITFLYFKYDHDECVVDIMFGVLFLKFNSNSSDDSCYDESLHIMQCVAGNGSNLWLRMNINTKLNFINQ